MPTEQSGATDFEESEAQDDWEWKKNISRLCTDIANSVAKGEIKKQGGTSLLWELKKWSNSLYQSSNTLSNFHLCNCLNLNYSFVLLYFKGAICWEREWLLTPRVLTNVTQEEIWQGKHNDCIFCFLLSRWWSHDEKTQPCLFKELQQKISRSWKSTWKKIIGLEKRSLVEEINVRYCL